MSLGLSYFFIGLIVVSLGSLILTPYSRMPTATIWIRLVLLFFVGGFAIFGFLASAELAMGSGRAGFQWFYCSLFLACSVSVFCGLRRIFRR